MGEKREFLANKQQLAAVLATRERGAVVWHLLQRRLMWGRAAGTPRRCPLWRKWMQEPRPWGMVTPALELAASLCCWRLGLHSAGGISIWGCLFFLSWDADLEGVGTYYISHLLMHATYINIYKCLSWWINNFHYLALVFSSGWSSIFKLFQWFAVCSSTKPSGVFCLDVFLLWSVAPCQSCPICLFRDTWTVPSVTRSVLFLSMPDTGTGGHSHCIPTGCKGTPCCANACSYLYNYREVIDCRGRFSNSDMTHLEDPDVIGTSSCVLFPTFLSRGAHDVWGTRKALL